MRTILEIMAVVEESLGPGTRAAVEALCEWSDRHPALRPDPHVGSQVVLKYALGNAAGARQFWSIYPNQDNLVLFFK